MEYLLDIPSYYLTPLRRALERMGLDRLMPPNLTENLSAPLPTLSTKIKNAATIEYSKLLKISTEANTQVLNLVITI
jgi:hypothetical protein